VHNKQQFDKASIALRATRGTLFAFYR